VAVLVPDPANAYDPNAIAVYVNNEHVGFLPRDLARRLRPALAAFTHANGGSLVACAAEIRWHDIGPQVVLLINPQPLGLRAEDFETLPNMAATIGRLLARLDEPAPPLPGIDAQARSSLVRAQQDLEETDAKYDRSPSDWPRVEAAFQKVAARLAKARDPYVSAAWLGLGRATRYQRGRRDDALSALIEALYWDRNNADAWSELVDLASAAPHVPNLLAVYARIPFGTRARVLKRLLIMSEQHDRLGRLDPAQGERLRKELLDLAESQGDKATVAALTGYAGLAAEKAGDLDAAIRWWRQAVAAGSTDARVADRFSVWLVKSHAYQEAGLVLQQALAVDPGSTAAAERMQRRLARCQRNPPG
jgi:tetratricopeptide (TPR) repeat protein